MELLTHVTDRIFIVYSFVVEKSNETSEESETMSEYVEQKVG